MTSVSTDRRQSVNAGAALKVPCRAATTANITLSGEQTIDGVACVTGDRVLVKNQTSGVNNGIYVVDTGTWTRAVDFDGTYDARNGTLVEINEGTVSARLMYVLTTSDPITIGTTSLTFTLVTVAPPLVLPLGISSGGTSGDSAVKGLAGLGVIACTAAAGTNAYTCTVDSTVTAYRTNQIFEFTPPNTNTGASTLTPTPSGAGALAGKNIFWKGAACIGGELIANVPVLLLYDGVQLNIIGNASAIYAGIIDAKGDLIVGTAADTPARKAVNTNGKMLIGDSSQPDGLLWAYKNIAPGGRLTLTTAVPVTTSDVTGATTVYYTTYRHDVVELYDGAGWIPAQFTELSQTTADATKSPAAVAINSNYDVFVWNDAGTLRATRGPLWTSDTARGAGAGTTELELFEGRYVNKNAITNGPAARRGLYVGSIRSDASSQINDSAAKRHVWNNRNRVRRPLLKTEATTSWAYSTAAFRQANASAANQVDVLTGLVEELIDISVLGNCSNSVSGTNAAAVGIGIGSTTVDSSQLRGPGVFQTASNANSFNANYSSAAPLGRQFFTWLEIGGGSNTQTWLGAVGSTVQSGVYGWVVQ